MMASLPKHWAGRVRALWRLGERKGLAAGHVRDLTNRLEAEKNALNSFTVAMEEEFLTLGALLRKITSVARDVKDRSQQVLAAAAGRTEDAALQFTFQLLKKAEDLVHASREQQAGVFRVFEKMHADLRHIARQRDALMRTLSPLDSTNTQFRIQACAFDEITREQFFALADSIGVIVRDVQTAVGQRFEDLERTGKATGELAARLTRLANEQKSETEKMLAGTRDHLSKLNDALLSSQAAAECMSQSGARIGGGVAKAIVALQCQDMARQKFQHIGSAIDEMMAHLAPGMATGFQGVEDADARHFLADASCVQLNQLRNVFQQLQEAAQQVEEGLQEIDSEAQRFGDSAQRSGSAALDGRMIGQAIDSIHGVLGVIDTAVDSIQGVLELVCKLKSTFSDCTSQILGLALSLRMVALNAQIFAARVDAGTALEVVASNTRMIADEAMKDLDEIGSRVNEMVDSVIELEERLRDYKELANQEHNLLASEAAVSEEKLTALELNLQTALSGIEPLERELSHGIQCATAAIRFPQVVAGASARSTGLFEEISRTYSNENQDSGLKTHHKVNAFKDNYTMAHERDVHESAIPQFTKTEVLLQTDVQDEFQALTPAAAHISEDDNNDRLADNVELF